MNLSLFAKTLLVLTLPWLLPFNIHAHAAVPAAYQSNTYENRVAVLMYHHISNTARSTSTITTRLFAAHLDALQQNGYHVISSPQLAAFLSGRAAVPPRAVVITFDDGYESFYKYAYPALRERHMPGTCFIIVSAVGAGADTHTRMNWKQVPKLTWAQMREMQEHDMSFYPHSYDNHYLAQTSPGPAGRNLRPALAGPIWLAKLHRRETQAEYERRVHSDLFKAKEIMEKELGRPVDQFSWPYGAASPAAMRIGESLGYKYFYFIDKGLDDQFTGPVHIRRINAGSPGITPDILLKNLNKYALLPPPHQWQETLYLFHPALTGQTILLTDTI
ncbi:polysaccharide deacetylase family protein [Desulfotomaculum copahuensis]|uniref:NodB homology domain-containing protein n=1 Tax=Desulfotomaculum copahuensis TaxID=1838280 RepID=A0A1B7LJJ6_9FIRM|nr:polysaccharide deacetylase family protein [Desulfotomaculum copahuensis]OAT86734.1 hypothetical protein A6M21_02650 [Desulfotomaculum copahuensis]